MYLLLMLLRKFVDSYSVFFVIYFFLYVNNLQFYKYCIIVEGEYYGYMFCFDYIKMWFFNFVQYCILQYFGFQYIVCFYFYIVYLIIDFVGIFFVFYLLVFIFLCQFCMKMCKLFVLINLNLRMCVNVKNDLKYDFLN